MGFKRKSKMNYWKWGTAYPQTKNFQEPLMKTKKWTGIRMFPNLKNNVMKQWKKMK